MVFVIKEENFSLGIKATEGKYDVSKKTAQKFQRASTSTPDFAISSSHSQKNTVDFELLRSVGATFIFYPLYSSPSSTTSPSSTRWRRPPIVRFCTTARWVFQYSLHMLRSITLAHSEYHEIRKVSKRGNIWYGILGPFNMIQAISCHDILIVLCIINV